MRIIRQWPMKPSMRRKMKPDLNINEWITGGVNEIHEGFGRFHGFDTNRRGF